MRHEKNKISRVVRVRKGLLNNHKLLMDFEVDKSAMHVDVCPKSEPKGKFRILWSGGKR